MVLICFNGVEWMILIGPPFEDLFLWAFVAPVATLARRFFFYRMELDQAVLNMPCHFQIWDIDGYRSTVSTGLL
jgi:hypothetical protein